jgi:hypothetical protein
VCAAVAALLTACSGGGDTPSAIGGGDTPAQTSAAPPKPTSFADFPGESLTYLEGGYKVGVKVKVIDATWSGEALGTPADPGKHYLLVYAVLTPELADRGAQKIKFAREVYVRYKPGKGGCEPESTGYCYAMGWPASELRKLDDHEDWRTKKWNAAEYVYDDIARGETRFGLVGFPIPDAVDTTEFEFCAPSKEKPHTESEFPCVPIKTPDGSR